MKKIIVIKSAMPVFLFGILALTGLVSCTSTQGMYSENDGIYESTAPPVRTQPEQVVIINDGSGQKYQKYFETEANNIYTGEDEIFTDVDSYSSYNDSLQGNVIINNYYNEGAAPWGYTDEYATVNMNIGYGGFWGYPYYGFYNPWYWGYGGYWGWGGGYWGWGGNWGWGGYYPPYYPSYPGYYPPYYGDSTYGKRSNYSVRGSDNTGYNRTSGNQYSRSSQASTRPNIYRESVTASTSGANRSSYQRSSGTRGYNNPSGNQNTNSSGNQGYNRSNTRSSTPSYNSVPRSSSGGGMRSSSGGGGYRRGPDMVQQDNITRSSDASLAASDSRGISSVINDNNISRMSRSGEGLASTNRKVMSDFSQRTRYVQASQTTNRESLIANAMSTNRKVMANFNERAKYVRSSVPTNSKNSGQSGSVYSRLNDSNSRNAANNSNSGQRYSSKSSGNSESRSSNNRQSASYSAPAYNSSSGGSSGGGSYSRPSSSGSSGGGSYSRASSGGSTGGSTGGSARGGSSR